MITLSIIIPVYNVEKYLAKCLDSVLVDNGFTGQVVCVNDGSTDGSGVILEEYAAKYPNVEIVTQKNAGLSAARNSGFERATGEYVFFMDSDDWLFEGSIQRVMERIEGEEILYFNGKMYSEERNAYIRDYAIKERRHMDGSSYFEDIYNEPRNMSCLCVCGGFYKRSFLMEHKLYNEPGIYHEDNYFTPQALLAAKDVSCVNEYLYAYRIRGGSITTHVTQKHVEDELFIARGLYKIYEGKGNVAEVFYGDVCNLYITLLGDGYMHAIPVHTFWQRSDSRAMLRCAKDVRSRRIAKLTYVSPRMAYRYMMEELPSGMRRVINRYL